MGHPQRRRAVGGQLPHRPLDDFGRFGVDGGGGFVQQQHLWAGHQRAGQAHPLRLAAGQGEHVAVQPRTGQRHPVQRLAHARLVGVRVGHPQVVRDGARERGRALETHADPAPQPQRVQPGDVGAVEGHPPARRQLQPVAQPQQGRFARSRRPEHRRHPAPGNRGGQPVQRPQPAPFDGDVDELEHRLLSGHPLILQHRGAGRPCLRARRGESLQTGDKYARRPLAGETQLRPLARVAYS